MKIQVLHCSRKHSHSSRGPT